MIETCAKINFVKPYFVFCILINADNFFLFYVNSFSEPTLYDTVTPKIVYQYSLACFSPLHIHFHVMLHHCVRY